MNIDYIYFFFALFILTWFISFLFSFHWAFCLIFTKDIFSLIHWGMSRSGCTVLSRSYSSHITLAVHCWTRAWENNSGDIATLKDFQLMGLLLKDWSKIAVLHIVFCSLSYSLFNNFSVNIFFKLSTFL